MKATARVLVADNNLRFLDVLEASLAAAGFECVAVKGGRAVAAECARRVPDAVLLDLSLRSLNGFDLFRLLRSDSRTKDIPVVFMTGIPDADLLESAARMIGAFAFLRKPVNLDHVSRTLKAAVGLPFDDEERAVHFPTVVNGPGLQIDLTARELFVEGRVERLEPKEQDILLTLIRRPGRLWPSDDLRLQVWGTRDPGYNSLMTRISALRRKLGGLRSRLQNERLRGYRFVE